MKRFTNVICVGAVMVATGIFTTAQDSVPPVYLTHSVIFVSAETYDALKASPLLHDELGSFREATNHAEGGALTYTGLYLSGIHTYFEIFKTGPMYSPNKVEPPGRIFLAMWIDHRTQLPVIHTRLPMVETGTIRDAQNRPWYDYIGENPAKTEGVNSFVSGLYPDGIVRSEPKYQPDRFLRDIVACTVTVGTAEREKLVRNFRAYGYTVREEGQETVASGPEFRLTMLQERTGEPRVASFEMTLNRAKVGDPSYRIGSSELRFVGNKATLRFVFPK